MYYESVTGGNLARTTAKVKDGKKRLGRPPKSSRIGDGPREEYRVFAESLNQVRNEMRMTRSRFAKQCDVPRSNMNAFLDGKKAPNFDTLERIRRATGASPTRLLLGKREEREEEVGGEFERSKSEDVAAAWREDFGIVQRVLKSQRYNRRLNSGSLSSALLRFAHTLRDAEYPDCAWYGMRDELISGAARFLVAVDKAFEEANQREGERRSADSTLSMAGLLLHSSSSLGWSVTWYDAVLDLFARRVFGLGERSMTFADAHHPTIDDRRRDVSRYL